jgi:serine/threonine protein kinase
LPQPQTLLEGKYEILKKLREGGMGTIYLVRHRLLDEVRAIKVMRAHVLADADLKRRFVEEAKVSTRLKHPNICTIHDFALGDDDTAYLVMEYIEGFNLADLLRSQGAPHPALTLEVAHQTLLALAYLHRKGVVHRDIAPDNLMLTHDAEDRTLIKLIDLGIAKTTTDTAASNLTGTGVFLGKLKYASPEQFGSLSSGEQLDGRSDLYGLGVVLYELLTGVRPFVGETPAELLRSHLFNPPLPFSQSDPEGKIPPALRALVMKALEKKREDRFASAEEFDNEILAFQGQFRPAREREDTRAMLARIPETEPIMEGVTPSAQDRLNFQFSGTTPRPSRDFRAVPAGAGAPEKANILRMVARKAGEPDPDETAAAPTPKSREVLPPPAAPRRPAAPPLSAARSSRSAAAWIVAAGLVAAGALLYLTRPRAARVGPQVHPAPTPALVAAPAVEIPPAATAAAPAPEPTAGPTAELAPPTAAPATAPPPDPRLRQALDAARTKATRARLASERARASDLAAEAYNRGRAMETDGALLVARNKTADATGAFDLAARFYAEAQATAQKAAAPPSPPAVPAVRPSPHSEPTAVAAAPEKPAAGPPPAPTRAAPTEQDRIRETVALYEKAQNTLDADLYARVYPSVDRSRIEAAFRSFASQSVTFEVRRIQLDPGGTKAEVSGFEKRIAAPRAGSEQRINSERVMHLRKQGDAWVISQLD